MSIINKLLASAALFSTAAAFAAPVSFDFKDPKGVNNVQFNLDAPLEAISGTGTGIAGAVSFDPANPAATTGKITLATASLTVGNPMMKDHLQGKMWLDVAVNPEISFEAISLANVKTVADKTTATVTGKLTIKGITKEITAPVSLTYLPGKLGARLGKADLKGDLLVLRTQFEVNRSDFGLMPGKMTEKVSETINVTLNLAGAAAQP